MFPLDLEEQLHRAWMFWLVLTDHDLRPPLDAHGLTVPEMTLGFHLLQAVNELRHACPWRPALTVEPEVLDHIRQICDRWFPIAEGPLAERYPEISHFLLRRSGGTVPPLQGLCAFVHRLDVLVHDSQPFGSDGPRARAFLEREGITEQEARRLKALIQPYLPPSPTEDELHGNERRLREVAQPLLSWYSRWWSVADRIVDDPDLRRRLHLSSKAPPQSRLLN